MDAFKQLYSVNYRWNISSPSHMRETVAEYLGGSINTGRIELIDVHRQKDPLLKTLLSNLRGMSGDTKAQLSLFESLCVSPGTGTVQYCICIVWDRKDNTRLPPDVNP
jgi:hypothetical protein